MMEKGRLVTDLKQHKFFYLLCNWCGEEQKHFPAEKHWLCDRDKTSVRRERKRLHLRLVSMTKISRQPRCMMGSAPFSGQASAAADGRIGTYLISLSLFLAPL